MNIFFTSEDPKECADNYDMVRLVKQLLESSQMLHLAQIEHGVPITAWPTRQSDNLPYKLTKRHRNHPTSIWVRQTRSNYLWTLQLQVEMNALYKSVYGKDHWFFLSGAYEKCLQSAEYIPEGSYTTPAVAFTWGFRNSSFFKPDRSPYDNYKHYFVWKWYLGGGLAKTRFNHRENGRAPDWSIELLGKAIRESLKMDEKTTPESVKLVIESNI